MLSETAWESCIFNVTSQTANNVRRAEPCGGGEEEEEEEDGGGIQQSPAPSLCATNNGSNGPVESSRQEEN